MKKLIFTLSLAVLPLFSCSSSDNDEENNTQTVVNNNKINPPSWIIGKWNSNNGVPSFYTFTSNDIVLSLGGYSQSYKYIADNGGYSQTSNDTQFTFTIGGAVNGGISHTYTFNKLSATKMNVSDGNSISEFIKE